ncbi:efflux RND transporter periplasmic adaptor subunit [Flavobacteriaceae bacterium TK19130]|nr:efflux RND transporter periplasmic adaptor subunit [Thermobacterium salinum]
MKYFLTFFSIALVLVACGDGGNNASVDSLIEQGDLSAIKQRRAELNEQQQQLNEQLDKLTTYIQKKENKRAAQLVTIETVRDTLFKHFVEVQGDVETDQNIVLFPEYSGVLTNVYVDEGQKVRKGQVLAKIDDGGLSSQLAQQESQVALAKTTYERQKRLWDQKIGSEIQYLQAQTNFEAAEKAAQQIRSQLAKTTIKAPFSGEVDNVIAEEGQVVSAGQSQVLRIVNLSDMYVKASIPENYLKSVNKGTEVKVRLSAIGEEFDGKVRQVGNYINPDNRTFDVEIEIPNKDGLVKPNMIATVKVNDYTQEDAITIPENILQENSRGESIAYLYVPKTDSTGTAKRVILETGLNYGNQIEVKSGIKAGDTVIVEGAKSLRDGQLVSYQNQ